MKQKKYILHRLFLGILIGLLAGGVICLYRYLMTICDKALNQHILPFLHSGTPFALPLWCVGLIVLAFIVHMVIRWESDARGGGIPHAQKEVEEGQDSTWDRVIIAKLITAPLCILAGFSLGKTGPAIEFGAMAGKGIATITHRIKRLFLYQPQPKIPTVEATRAGIAAGLSALFHAPVAGIFFTLEKLKKTRNISLITILSASVTAFYVSITVYDHTPIVPFSLTAHTIIDYACFSVLGIFMGISGTAYANSLSYFTKKLSTRNGFSQLTLWTVLFVLAGIVGFYLPEITGGGTNLFVTMLTPSSTLRLLCLLVFGKYLFSMISSGSGLPGGTVFPLLTVGGCLGQCLGMAIQLFFPTLEITPLNLVIPGMAGFFTSVIGAPLTGVFLLCEFTCQYDNFLPLAITCGISHFVAKSLKK